FRGHRTKRGKKIIKQAKTDIDPDRPGNPTRGTNFKAKTKNEKTTQNTLSNLLNNYTITEKRR
ncbi:hypothetical protein, partial [Stenotrophomonas maltophilia]|uniref:hypothetical protein n=1 Tax=Stenotrophomonas maltophilia TaxID=40324 RepID=UPI0031452C01